MHDDMLSSSFVLALQLWSSSASDDDAVGLAAKRENSSSSRQANDRGTIIYVLLC